MGMSRAGWAPGRVIPLATSLIPRPFHSSLPPHRIKSFPFFSASLSLNMPCSEIRYPHLTAVVLTSRSNHLLLTALETNLHFVNVGQLEVRWGVGLQLTIIFIIDNNLSIIFSINQLVVWSIKSQKMVKNVDRCFPKPKVTSWNVLFCLFYCHWGLNTENIHIWEAEIREFRHFFLKKMSQNN